MASRSGLLIASVVFVVAAAAGLGAGWLWLAPTPQERQAALQQQTGATVLPRDYARLPDVAVHTADGRPLREALADDWSLLFLGFTHCPDVCPISLQALAATAERLDSGTMPRVAFISVDPRRDSAADASRYAAAFDEAFVGATGEMPALRRLTGTLHVDFQVPDAAADAEYAVEHPSTVFLLDPQGRLRAVFSAPHDPEAMAADLRAILQTLGRSS